MVHEVQTYRFGDSTLFWPLFRSPMYELCCDASLTIQGKAGIINIEPESQALRSYGAPLHIPIVTIRSWTGSRDACRMFDRNGHVAEKWLGARVDLKDRPISIPRKGTITINHATHDVRQQFWWYGWETNSS